MQSTQFINIASIDPLVPPRVVREELPQSEKAYETVVAGRNTIARILSGEDARLLVVVGPCSVHDEKSALEYAERLRGLCERVRDRLYLVMRVYFEKPRTTIGWKGLINDPSLDGTFDIASGLRRARAVILQLAEMGLPAGTEILDPITPPYMSDLVAWASLGARTTESQTHRQMASGLSMPIGFKNGTDGDVQVAVDAMEAARHAHTFVGINLDGQTSVVNTTGNPLGHLILRGGRPGPNYDAGSVAAAAGRLSALGLTPRVMVDCSHANSYKDYRNQGRVWRDVVGQIARGSKHLLGLMLESNLFEGNQRVTGNLSALQYGVSITDGCIGWEETEDLIGYAYEAVSPQSEGVPSQR